MRKSMRKKVDRTWSYTQIQAIYRLCYWHGSGNQAKSTGWPDSDINLYSTSVISYAVYTHLATCPQCKLRSTHRIIRKPETPVAHG